MDVRTSPLARPRRLLQTLNRLGRVAADLILPPACPSCRAPVGEPHALCAGCWSAIGFLDGPCCQRCGLPFELDPGAETVCGGCLARPPKYDAARSVMRYDEASKVPILAFKRADRLDIAKAFVRWLQRSGAPLIAGSDVIVPVPLHPLRLWQRRYNQAAVLAAGLAKASGLPHDPFCLARIRATPSQGTMPSAKARRRNVRGAFQVPPQKRPHMAGKRVLLIDDVFTTGATLEACAGALKRGGAKAVYVLTLARVVRGA